MWGAAARQASPYEMKCRCGRMPAELDEDEGGKENKQKGDGDERAGMEKAGKKAQVAEGKDMQECQTLGGSGAGESAQCYPRAAPARH